MDEPTNSSAVRPILEPTRKGKKELEIVIRKGVVVRNEVDKVVKFEISRIWNIEKAKENKKLEVNVRKQRKLEVIEGITLDVITGDHE